MHRISQPLRLSSLFRPSDSVRNFLEYRLSPLFVLVVVAAPEGAENQFLATGKFDVVSLDSSFSNS